jgi:hypothetical protein
VTGSTIVRPRGAVALAWIPTLCLVVLASGLGAPLLGLVVGVTVLTCPGLALLSLMPPGRLSTEITLVVASSVAINVVIAEVFLLSGAWNPLAIMTVIWALSLVAATRAFYASNPIDTAQKRNSPRRGGPVREPK